MDTWSSISNGRRAFADYLAGLAAGDWDKPSLCAGWTVKQVAAHMLVIPTMSKGKVFRAFLGSGFNLDKMNATLVKRLSSTMSNTDMVAAMRTSADSRSIPPGLKVPGVLNELAVHSADVSEGVGMPFALPAETYVAALEHVKKVQSVFGTKQRIAGLGLRSTDAPWSTGSGPAVEGTAQQLLLACTGRASSFAHLTGDGVAIMRAR